MEKHLHGNIPRVGSLSHQQKCSRFVLCTKTFDVQLEGIFQLQVRIKQTYKASTTGQTKLCHHPPPAKIYPPPPIATHQHAPPSKIYPPPPTTNQSISTTIHPTQQQPKYIHHHQPQSKIYSSKRRFYKKNIKIFILKY